MTKVNLKLSFMMFVEWFIWGAWFVPLWQILSKNNFTATQVGLSYATTAIAAILSPIIVCSITDRFFAAQKVLSVLCLLGAVFMYLAAQQTTFNTFFPILLLYSLTYMPTIALTNSITFSHVTDIAKHYPVIRVLGTIGWIFSGFVCGFLPEWLGFGDISSSNIPLIITAAASLFLGIYSLILPNTPPKPTQQTTLKSLLGIDAMALLKDKNFCVFAFCSFLFCIPLDFYYAFANGFLTENGMKNATGWMSLGQVSEIFFMLCLPFFIHKMGIKKVLLLGLITGALRYILFIYGGTDNMLLYSFLFVGILLHGVCYDFYFVTAYIYVDKKSPVHMRSSAQALITLFCQGFGSLFSYLLGGALMDHLFKYETPQNNLTYHWVGIWVLGAVMIIAILFLFLCFFKEKKEIQPIVLNTDLKV